MFLIFNFVVNNTTFITPTVCYCFSELSVSDSDPHRSALIWSAGSTKIENSEEVSTFEVMDVLCWGPIAIFDHKFSMVIFFSCKFFHFCLKNPGSGAGSAFWSIRNTVRVVRYLFFFVIFLFVHGYLFPCCNCFHVFSVLYPMFRSIFFSFLSFTFFVNAVLFIFATVRETSCNRKYFLIISISWPLGYFLFYFSNACYLIYKSTSLVQSGGERVRVREPGDGAPEPALPFPGHTGPAQAPPGTAAL